MSVKYTQYNKGGSMKGRVKNIARQKCHRGAVHVFDYRNLHFYGGGLLNGVYIPARGRWLIISAVECDIGTISTNYKTNYLKDWANLPVIKILIEDGKAPDLPKEFWKSLIQELSWMSEGDDLNILTMCEGGHGRTGTILSILAGMLLNKDDPVQFVRDSYCQLAIENLAQKAYIADITDTELHSAVGGRRLKKPKMSLDEEEKARQRAFLDGITMDEWEEWKETGIIKNKESEK